MKNGIFSNSSHKNLMQLKRQHNVEYNNLTSRWPRLSLTKRVTITNAEWTNRKTRASVNTSFEAEYRTHQYSRMQAGKYKVQNLDNTNKGKHQFKGGRGKRFLTKLTIQKEPFCPILYLKNQSPHGYYAYLCGLTLVKVRKPPNIFVCIKRNQEFENKNNRR